MTQERPVRVQQADADGCGVAVLAMLTGQTYAQVDAEWPLRLTGHWKHSDVKPHMMRDYLWKHGYSLRVIRDRRYAAGGAWPSIRPFAPMHYAMVDSPTQPTGHWIAIDAEGTVLDPFDGSRTTLAAYAKMHEVVGVWPALGAVAASPDEGYGFQRGWNAATDRLVGRLHDARDELAHEHDLLLKERDPENPGSLAYQLRAVAASRPADERTHYVFPDAEDAGNENATACGSLPLAEPSREVARVDCLRCLRLLAVAGVAGPADEGLRAAVIDAADLFERIHSFGMHDLGLWQCLGEIPKMIEKLGGAAAGCLPENEKREQHTIWAMYENEPAPREMRLDTRDEAVAYAQSVAENPPPALLWLKVFRSDNGAFRWDRAPVVSCRVGDKDPT